MSRKHCSSRNKMILKLNLLGDEVIKACDSARQVCTLRVYIKFRFGARKEIQSG